MVEELEAGMQLLCRRPDNDFEVSGASRLGTTPTTAPIDGAPGRTLSQQNVSLAWN